MAWKNNKLPIKKFDEILLEEAKLAKETKERVRESQNANKSPKKRYSPQKENKSRKSGAGSQSENGSKKSNKGPWRRNKQKRISKPRPNENKNEPNHYTISSAEINECFEKTMNLFGVPNEMRTVSVKHDLFF